MKLSFSYLFAVVLFSVFFIQGSALAEQCDDGRVPCSHPCDASARPACKDSKGVAGKPHCVTPQYCRDTQTPTCDPGWYPRANNCSQAERATRGCQDAQGRNGAICVRYTR